MQDSSSPVAAPIPVPSLPCTKYLGSQPCHAMPFPPTATALLVQYQVSSPSVCLHLASECGEARCQSNRWHALATEALFLATSAHHTPPTLSRRKTPVSPYSEYIF